MLEEDWRGELLLCLGGCIDAVLSGAWADSCVFDIKRSMENPFAISNSILIYKVRMKSKSIRLIFIVYI